MIRSEKQGFKLRYTGKKIFLICISAIITLNLSGCYLYPSAKTVAAPALLQSPKTKYELLEVKKGTIEQNYRKTGYFVYTGGSQSLFYRDSGMRLKSINVKPGQIVNAGDVLVEADTTDLEKKIRDQQYALTKIQLSNAQLKASSGTDPFILQKALLDENAAKSDLDDYYTALEKTKLVSPISGKVTYVSTTTNKGDLIAVNKVMVTVVDSSQLNLVYTSNPKDPNDMAQLYGIFPDMKVNVELRGKMYEGKVLMTPREFPSDAGDLVKNSIRMQVFNLPPDISAGERAIFSITLDKRENVIALPRCLVVRSGNFNYVSVLENGSKKDKFVKVGFSTTAEIEIVSGLSEGDMVIRK